MDPKTSVQGLPKSTGTYKRTGNVATGILKCTGKWLEFSCDNWCKMQIDNAM